MNKPCEHEWELMTSESEYCHKCGAVRGGCEELRSLGEAQNEIEQLRALVASLTKRLQEMAKEKEAAEKIAYAAIRKMDLEIAQLTKECNEARMQLCTHIRINGEVD